MPRRASERLTDRLARALLPPAQGARITYDAEVPGFGIRVTAAGARSFVLNYVVAGHERRLTIGRFPAWSATAAREEARALRRKVDAGIDPLAERAARDGAALAERTAPTVADLFARYAAEHLPRKAPRSAADDRSMWEKLVLPRLGRLKVTAVTPADIDALHAEVGKTRPVRANRVVEVVRKAFNLAIRWGWRADNPASGVHRNHEERRARYLTPAEILRLSEALAAHPERTSANAIRLLLLTGARRGEVLGARWEMLDLDAGIWVKPSGEDLSTRQSHSGPAGSCIPAATLPDREKERSGALTLWRRGRAGTPAFVRTCLQALACFSSPGRIGQSDGTASTARPARLRTCSVVLPVNASRKAFVAARRHDDEVGVDLIGRVDDGLHHRTALLQTVQAGLVGRLPGARVLRTRMEEVEDRSVRL